MQIRRPGKPRANQEFQYGYGYAMPQRFIRWEWSADFNRWGAIVEFDDMPIYTWPKDETPIDHPIAID
jgi:hypothetical protein